MARNAWDRYILVVEDDPPLRDLYRSALRSAGYAVVGVNDGIDALRMVESQRPAAVVLDLALPRLGGRDVHRELKARPSTERIPVVVVSGTDTSDLNPGDFAGILHKPITADVLVEVIDGCMRSRGLSVT